MNRRDLGLALLAALAAVGAIAAPPANPVQVPQAPAVESGYAEVEGGRIFYETAGRGPAIVMIHDGLLHRETWDRQFREFARDHRVVRWDRRGYGRSDPPQAPFSNRQDLLAVFNAAGVESATLMGCSSGALLALEFTLDHPERVSALVLVGPIVSGFDFSEHFRTRGGRGMPGRDASVAQRIEYWTERDPWIMAVDSADARRRMRALLEAHPQNLTGSGRYARPPRRPTRSRLPGIAVPALIVVGEADIPDVHAHAGVIQAAIPGAKRVVLAHSGHLCHLEKPNEFDREVRRFLEGAD